MRSDQSSSDYGSLLALICAVVNECAK